MNEFEDRQRVGELAGEIASQEGFETFVATRDDGMLCILMGADEFDMNAAARETIEGFDNE